MKKTFLLSAFFALLLCGFSSYRSSAQITAISISYAFDSSSTYCTLPSANNFFLYGTVTGTAPSPDSVLININYGDGSDTTFYTAESGGSFSAYLNHTYGISGTFAPLITATSTSGITTTYSVSSFSLSDDCGSLSGKLYVDGNGNCTPDAGESGLAWAPIMAINTTTLDTFLAGFSDDTGAYTINLVPGTYNIIPANYYWSYWYYDSALSPTCPASGMYSLTVTGGSSATENFAYTCNPYSTIDMSAEAWSPGFVPGDTTYITLYAGEWDWYWYYTCASLSSTVTLTLDPNLTYVSTMSSWGAPTISGSTLTWNMSTVADLFYFSAQVIVVTNTSVALGDTICNTVYVAPTAYPDPNLSNNTYHFCRPATSSFDPNGKEVSPLGEGSAGFIPDGGTPLSYMIHFQNTGTAVAHNVTVVDTLDADLDISTFHILQSQAPVDVYIDGHTLKLRFSNINLPDSLSDPVNSMSSVIYGIKPKTHLAPGTQITNKAAIYFDYNAPVYTGTTLNTIQIPTGVQQVANNFKAAVYPNPADEQVIVTTADKAEFTVTISDMLGKVIATDHTNTGRAAMNTRNIAEGIYIVSVSNGQGGTLTSKLTIKH